MSASHANTLCYTCDSKLFRAVIHVFVCVLCVCEQNQRVIHFISKPGAGYRLLEHFYTYIFVQVLLLSTVSVTSMMISVHALAMIISLSRLA